MPEDFFRKPAFAGKFYESAAGALLRQVESCVDGNAERRDAVGCVLPHAGYAYSGRVAGKTISAVNIPERIVILGPNHTGLGEPFSVMLRGTWSTPLGDCRIDTELAENIASQCDFLSDDFKAQAVEHSIEVELPLLQFFRKDLRIVPIVVGSVVKEKLFRLGEGIAGAVLAAGQGKPVLIIASSDMTHYEPQKNAIEKDRLALEAIESLDEELLYNRVNELNITMCGYAPVVSLLRAVKLLGAKNARVVEYATSARVTGDYNSVVGYAGVIITR
jgi:AmmeMemoRadiSam system protein B